MLGIHFRPEDSIKERLIDSLYDILSIVEIIIEFCSFQFLEINWTCKFYRFFGTSGFSIKNVNDYTPYDDYDFDDLAKRLSEIPEDKDEQ